MTDEIKPTLYIIRGLPGSGKSTLARKLVSHANHYEADMFFVNDQGEYKYDPAGIGDAHAWCRRNILKRLQYWHQSIHDGWTHPIEVERGDCNVAVSNTFTRRWEYQQYLEMCLMYNYTACVIVMQNIYDNIHSVPVDVIERMQHRWED